VRWRRDNKEGKVEGREKKGEGKGNIYIEREREREERGKKIKEFLCFSMNGDLALNDSKYKG
jgi:hypothetical protein